ncbi:TPA: hypothetical protein QDC20_006103 [Burkholderia aenigmatica]|uniref:hypothetical protein n=1 Tax=Burkholderia sp. AU45251 TaxID=3059204 RepID=UPI00264E81B0|nr:hypothetical protein [Burkholderia sp. AU45251]HDR9488136.1 hypothetical protein [Burkholderia aenigmatica]MDN7520930.1 hypothetical protein [Burkholderia sp. AU45251]HDR9519899.1 hypothetical protein [Burkholderia aenigmatica]HDR9596929.1 hypothetical protein [Burkholderia aenigmatica]HDR9605111.1 hypothetical protein [Burkholderia aenigmatica]
MKYVLSGLDIHIGDHVIVEGDVTGIVVCDFDKRRRVAGYDDWLIDRELVGGGKLSEGILVKTKALGFLYYSGVDDDIVKDPQFIDTK